MADTPDSRITEVPCANSCTAPPTVPWAACVLCSFGRNRGLWRAMLRPKMPKTNCSGRITRGPRNSFVRRLCLGASVLLASCLTREVMRLAKPCCQVVGRHEGRKHRRAAVQEHHRTSGSYWSNRSTKHGRLPRHLDEEPRDVRGQGRTEPPTTGTAGIAGAAFAMLRIFAVSLPAASNRASCCVQRKRLVWKLRMLSLYSRCALGVSPCKHVPHH